MITFSVQASGLHAFREALKSSCTGVRLGSEFCMYDLPKEKALIEAFHLSSDAGKGFTYVTPRVSDDALAEVSRHFEVLSGLGTVKVVVNDLGSLNILRKFPNLKPQLGRQLVYIPGRCPWPQITEHPAGFFAKRKVEQIFYQTALNYEPTIRFYREMGVQAADVDWIPRSFKHYKELVEHGVNLSVHVHLVPAALTRKCHTARLLGEESLDSCSKPCYSRAYKMENEALKVALFLQGNGVFRIMEPTKKEADQLGKIGVSELVLTMRPVTGIETAKDIQLTMDNLRS